MLADFGRAGEADLADRAAGNQRLADQARVAVDELGDAGGDARLGERSEQLGRAARRFVRRARDHGAARGERGADLLGEQVEREVPWSEGRYRADRLTDDAAGLTGGAHERPAVIALGVLGVPVKQLR